MNWIVSAMLMVFCSVVSYLALRYGSLKGMPLSLQNFASFFVPLVVYSLIAVSRHESLEVNTFQFILLVLSAVLFSYAGSKFSLLSIKYAPNPGYSLVISKSYVLFTTVFAVIFFNAELPSISAIAIVIILLCSALILIEPKQTKTSSSHPLWFPYTLATFFCWGMLAISSKYLLDIGVGVYVRLMYVMAIVSVLIAFDMKREGAAVRVALKRDFFTFMIIGFGFTGLNYYMQLGYQLAPNIGYINAMNAGSIALVTVGAVLLFKDNFSTRKFIGVLGVIGGILLLVF